MMSTDATNCAIEARQTIFGTIISGSLNGDQVHSIAKRKELMGYAAVTQDVDKVEITTIGKEVPLELLFRNVIRTQIDEDTGKKPDYSVLQQRAHQEFYDNVQLISSTDGENRFKVKLSRLPEELYPLRVDGKAISGSALNRFFALEKRLNHVRSAKLLKGVHERVEILIDDKIMVPISEWEAKKDEFLKDQTPGNEKILLPWQNVVASGKATEHSKIRMCLDGTQRNKLLYKFESEMPDLMLILLRWRYCKYWCCIDVVKMF